MKNYRLLYTLVNALPLNISKEVDIQNPLYVNIWKTKNEYEVKFGFDSQNWEGELSDVELNDVGKERFEYAKSICNVG